MSPCGASQSLPTHPAAGGRRLYSVYKVRGQPRVEMWPVETDSEIDSGHIIVLQQTWTDNTRGVLTETLYLSTEGFCQRSLHRTNTPKCCSVQICHRGGGGGRGGGWWWCRWGAPQWWLPSSYWFELMSQADNMANIPSCQLHVCLFSSLD